MVKLHCSNFRIISEIFSVVQIFRGFMIFISHFSQLETPESSHPLSASSRSPLDSDNPEDWRPYKDADLALREAQRKISQDDW